MGKTNRSPRQNKNVSFRITSLSKGYRPVHKFHHNKAIPTKQFKDELNVQEKMREQEKDLERGDD